MLKKVVATWPSLWQDSQAEPEQWSWKYPHKNAPPLQWNHQELQCIQLFKETDKLSTFVARLLTGTQTPKVTRTRNFRCQLFSWTTRQSTVIILSAHSANLKLHLPTTTDQTEITTFKMTCNVVDMAEGKSHFQQYCDCWNYLCTKKLRVLFIHITWPPGIQLLLTDQSESDVCRKMNIWRISI